MWPYFINWLFANALDLVARASSVQFRNFSISSQSEPHYKGILQAWWFSPNHLWCWIEKFMLPCLWILTDRAPWNVQVGLNILLYEDEARWVTKEAMTHYIAITATISVAAFQGRHSEISITVLWFSCSKIICHRSGKQVIYKPWFAWRWDTRFEKKNDLFPYRNTAHFKNSHWDTCLYVYCGQKINWCQKRNNHLMHGISGICVSVEDVSAIPAAGSIINHISYRSVLSHPFILSLRCLKCTVLKLFWCFKEAYKIVNLILSCGLKNACIFYLYFLFC